MKIVVLPRDEGTPYQRLLYKEMRSQGAEISFLGELTHSHTLNLVLLPIETVIRRALGARIIHVHWTYGFGVPGAGILRGIRWVAQKWFLLWLAINRFIGMRIVWTAHNVLPHEPVFADDKSARRALVAASSLVIAHSESALTALRAIGAEPSHAVVIPHGAIKPNVPVGTLRVPGEGAGPRRFLFFGRLESYKGAEDLIAAFARLPAHPSARLLIAGQCSDGSLRSRLRSLASSSASVTLRLEHAPEDEVTQLLEEADVVVLPFRRITTSGSALLALGHGRPLIVPDLEALSDLPDKGVLRYDGSVPGLTEALYRMAATDEKALAAMAAAARDYADLVSWSGIAKLTMAEFQSIHPRYGRGAAASS